MVESPTLYLNTAQMQNSQLRQMIKPVEHPTTDGSLDWRPSGQSAFHKTEERDEILVREEGHGEFHQQIKKPILQRSLIKLRKGSGSNRRNLRVRISPNTHMLV